jgi:hypothetical protein
MSPAIHHEMQCFLVTTRERCVVTTRGSCDRYLVRVKGGVHLGNQFAGSYEVEPTGWHLFVFIGTNREQFRYTRQLVLRCDGHYAQELRE